MTDPTPPTPVKTPPAPSNWREVVQVLASCAIGFGISRLTLFIGHLSPFQLAAIYAPLSAAWYAVVTELEHKYPKWGWLLYLVPSQLPAG